MLPILKRSLNIIKNSEFAEYEDFLYQVINLIEMKGSVISNDIEEIIINSDQEPSGLHFSSMIVATINRVAGVFPLF